MSLLCASLLNFPVSASVWVCGVAEVLIQHN
jgi:hypothetical protein